MRREIANLSIAVVAAGLLSLGLLLIAAQPIAISAQAQGEVVTAFEGARVIAADGSAAIENGVIVVTGARFTQVGSAAQVQIPAGARRVDLRGKTVMPAIIDTHTHMATEREMLIDQLRRKAYYGVGVVASLGQDTGD